MLAYLAASGVVLTHMRRPLGQYTVKEQRYEGQFRHVTTRCLPRPLPLLLLWNLPLLLVLVFLARRFPLESLSNQLRAQETPAVVHCFPLHPRPSSPSPPEAILFAGSSPTQRRLPSTGEIYVSHIGL
eukprot:752121-Hanusia_phi.AAC.1